MSGNTKGKVKSQHAGIWGSGDLAPIILNLSSTWMLVISFNSGERAPSSH